MQPHDILIGILWAIAAAGLAWYVSRAATEIRYVTLADGRRQERKLPISLRLLLPLAPNLTGFFSRPRYLKTQQRTTRQIVAAGLEGLLSAPELMALKILNPAVFGPIWIVAIHLLVSNVPGRIGRAMAEWSLLFDLLVLLYLYVSPGLWLSRVLRKRHFSIERALPFVLDLLTLSVEAGLDFMSSIQRIIERRKLDPLGEELIRMFREVQLGKTRRESLKSLAARVNQPDVNSVVNALVQADELGVSIGSILRIQADQMRTRRFQRAEKLANEAPVKMLFPLVAFIFPAVFIVLLGPVILDFLRHGL